MKKLLSILLGGILVLSTSVSLGNAGTNNCKPAWKCQSPTPTRTATPTPTRTTTPTINPTQPPSGSVTPNDPTYPQQWALTLTKTNEAWTTTTGGPIIIAVLDTGADLDQPELVGKLVQGRDTINGDNDPQDGHSHGTATAGIAGAATNNGADIATYCWGCKVMPIKVFRDDGTTTWTAITNGVLWAADHGADIISMSFCCGSTTAFYDAVKYAYSKGIVLVTAGGGIASGWPEVIGVVGVNQDGTNAEGREADIGAPFCNRTIPIGGPNSSYDFCAASSLPPAISGIVGLGLTRCPNATPAQIVAKLMETGHPIPNYNTNLVNTKAFVNNLC